MANSESYTIEISPTAFVIKPELKPKDHQLLATGILTRHIIRQLIKGDNEQVYSLGAAGVAMVNGRDELTVASASGIIQNRAMHVVRLLEGSGVSVEVVNLAPPEPTMEWRYDVAVDE